MTVEIAFGAVGNFRNKIGEIQSNGRLSPRGQAHDIRAAAEKPQEFFTALKQQSEVDRQKLQKRADHFQLKPPARDDIVAAMDRQEIRQWLRSLKPGEAVKVALSDPGIAAAIVSAPAALSGLDPASHARVVEFERERQFGKELKILKAEADELDVVDVAVQTAHEQFMRDVDAFDERHFETATKLVVPGKALAT